ncbi:hypothetical protein PQQ51_01925 [Paraburkholderia xenovorans]|uniref:hypothetical protein n=1 Tax=Paraburkholderia xenovorans TaxID=36873 RepID=UPI0038BD5206
MTSGVHNNIPLRPMRTDEVGREDTVDALPQNRAGKTIQRSSDGVLGALSKLTRPASTTVSTVLGLKTTARPSGPRAPVDVSRPRTEGAGTHSYGLLSVSKHVLNNFGGVSGNGSDYNPHEQVQTLEGTKGLVAAHFGVDIATLAADAPHHPMLDNLVALHPTNHEHAALTGVALARVCDSDAARANAACKALDNPAAASPAARRDAFAVQRAMVKGGNGLDAVRSMRGLPHIADRVGHAVQSQALNTQMTCAERLLQGWPAGAGAAPESIEELTRLINTALPRAQRQADLPTDSTAKPSLRELANSIEGRALVAAAVMLKTPDAKLQKDLGKAYLPARNNIYTEAQVRDFSAEMFGMLSHGMDATSAGNALGLGTIVNSTPLTSLKKGTGGQMMREPKADFAEFQQAAVRSITALVGDFNPDTPAANRAPETNLNMVRAFAVANWCKQVGSKGWSDKHTFSKGDLIEITRDAQRGLGIADGSDELTALKVQIGTLKSVDLKTLRGWLNDAGADVSPGTEHGNQLSALNRYEQHGNTFAGGQLDHAKLDAAVTGVAMRLRETPTLKNELRAGALEHWSALTRGVNSTGTAPGWTKGMPLPESARDALAQAVATKLGRTVADVKRSPEFAQIGPMGVDTLRAWAQHGGIKDGELHTQLTQLTSHIKPDADDFVDGVRAAIEGSRTTYPVIMQRTERLGFNMNVPLSIRDAIEHIKLTLPKAVGEIAPMSLLMGPDVAMAGSRVKMVVAGSTAISGTLDVTQGYGFGGHAGWATIATANIGTKEIKGQGIATGQLWMNADATVSKGWTLRSRMVPGQPDAWRTELLASYDAMLGKRGDRPATPDDLFDRLCDQHAANPDVSISPLEVARYSGGPSFNVTVGARADINNWKPGVSMGMGAQASYTATSRGDTEGTGTIKASITNRTFGASGTLSASTAVGVPTAKLDKGPVSVIAFPSIPVVGISVVTVPVARGGTARISIEDGKLAPTTVWDDESVRVKDLTTRTERPERRRAWITSLGGGAVGEKKLNEFLNHCEGETDKGNLLIADRQIIRPEAVAKINTLLALREIHISGATTTPVDQAQYDECSKAISGILQSDDSWKNRFLYLLENTVDRETVGPDIYLTAQTINEVLTPHQLHALPAEFDNPR